MLNKEECENALNKILWNIGVARSDYRTSGKAKEDYHTLKSLIEEHFSNPPLEWEERVKFLEKQLDIAIKELCFTAKGADACNSLDNLYEGIKEWIEEKARKEVQE